MKKVLLNTNNYTSDTYFTVSDEIYEKVSSFKWRVQNTTNLKSTVPHFSITRKSTAKEKLEGHPNDIYLHRFIFGLLKGDKRVVDHINNWLDNTFEGLRVTSSKNNTRFGPGRLRKSRRSVGLPKGVCFNNRSKENPYKAGIKVNGKSHFLGHFSTPELAHEAYCKAAELYFGTFARFK